MEVWVFLACTVTQYKNKSKNIKWMKSRNCDEETSKDDTYPSFKSVGFSKLQIFVEIFCTKLQSLVWSRHVGVPPWNTNMAAGK